MTTTIEERPAAAIDDRDAGRGIFEFLDGAFVEKIPMGSRATLIGFLLMNRLWDHVRSRGLGLCLPENCVYRIFPEDPRRTRIPDGSFVRSGRLPDGVIPEGDMTIAPDLAVEVISRSNTVEDLEGRLVDYLGAGVRLCWVVIPGAGCVYIHRADNSITRLRGGDVLSGEDVIPGFAMPVSDIFEIR